MNILLTGATGFLGSHLARALVQASHRLVIVKRSSSDCARLADIASEMIAYDADEEASVYRLFAEQGPFDAVIHAATAYGRRGESDVGLLEANVLFPLRLLQLCCEQGTRLFVNTDTFSRDSLAQGAPHLAGYHLTKKQFAEWGAYIAKKYGLTFANMRLEHVYGPFDQSDKFIPYVISQCLRDGAQLALTSGEQKRDFVYVEDVVAAYLLLLREKSSLPAEYAEFQVGTGKATAVRELVEKIHSLTRSTAVLQFGAFAQREGELMCSQADTGKLGALGWQARVSLEQGLKLILQKEAAD
ncbi:MULTISPECIES: NAD-dependent epimerase/dehydratase family protein [Brevibacillus]|uniref:NAD-dependent epimerase/dehydratase family protein n=1 Tax=Brevibacillus TaxID=55080 RepID=UPI000EC2679A|nr:MULTISPECIES: NAD-dependent epimerase/dehydratase family protein [Brevibacillus]MDR5002191.1 NAD-dependent epimerase/dehydratase family protein [Brevibacillus parabrevis]MED2256249.1 NAD-dependent epimerase/dehydratase family protein [Brevibacillus parabrevis]NRQ53169.1 NAD-dependent epimerase/dehydratase family protein [Brevibacillus sp. HD1.4A]WDV97012.1 NAD-dependent epimerase/dehydratase family protein [Brevibacillus parabrevis]HBZ83690.1 epimerase [Brevibacillus sp.]